MKIKQIFDLSFSFQLKRPWLLKILQKIQVKFKLKFNYYLAQGIY